MQAVIFYSGQMDPSTNSSSIQLGRSVALDAGLYASSGSNGVYGVQLSPSNTTMGLEFYSYLPDIGMQSAFINGLYNSSKGPPTRRFIFFCPTANCTWPIFTSMAVCSACNDVSSHLQRRKENGTNLGTLTLPAIGITGEYITYSLPRLNLTNFSGRTLSKSNDTTWNNLYSLAAYMSATRITDPQLTLSFQHLNTMITAVEVLKAAEEYEAGESTWQDTPISATECALYFCVNTYQSDVTNGILTERIIASWAERNFSSYYAIGKVGSTPAFDEYEKMAQLLPLFRLRRCPTQRSRVAHTQGRH